MRSISEISMDFTLWLTARDRSREVTATVRFHVSFRQKGLVQFVLHQKSGSGNSASDLNWGNLVAPKPCTWCSRVVVIVCIVTCCLRIESWLLDSLDFKMIQVDIDDPQGHGTPSADEIFTDFETAEIHDELSSDCELSSSDGAVKDKLTFSPQRGCCGWSLEHCLLNHPKCANCCGVFFYLPFMMILYLLWILQIVVMVIINILVYVFCCNFCRCQCCRLCSVNLFRKTDW